MYLHNCLLSLCKSGSAKREKEAEEGRNLHHRQYWQQQEQQIFTALHEIQGLQKGIVKHIGNKQQEQQKSSQNITELEVNMKDIITDKNQIHQQSHRFFKSLNITPPRILR